ncbi:VVA0879 family protein [Bradyrhizobium sp. Pa8]|uniref:VVA0879 family protein n=1 Tax=Bradyrhizobium sp. Pa8 TaxID=3386552 RepID=UPI00403F28DB
MTDRITISMLHDRLRAQGVSGREHAAFKCVVCETVQSMASLKRAGCPDGRLENQIGFSCEGRWSGAGPWPNDPDKQAERRGQTDKRGCNWTLGGLFRIHKLEVLDEAGQAQALFEPASPEEAQALEAWLKTKTAELAR